MITKVFTFVTVFSLVSLGATSPVRVQERATACTPSLTSDAYNIFVASDHTKGWKFSAGSGGSTVVVPSLANTNVDSISWTVTPVEGGLFSLSTLEGSQYCVAPIDGTGYDRGTLVGEPCSSAGHGFNIACDTCGTTLGDPFASGCVISWSGIGYSSLGWRYVSSSTKSTVVVPAVDEGDDTFVWTFASTGENVFDIATVSGNKQCLVASSSFGGEGQVIGQDCMSVTDNWEISCTSCGSAGGDECTFKTGTSVCATLPHNEVASLTVAQCVEGAEEERWDIVEA
ncbi:hypothetical protein T439DRAFT_350868 [Meredithblackwellia eburnea MCA 4105]